MQYFKSLLTTIIALSIVGAVLRQASAGDPNEVPLPEIDNPPTTLTSTTHTNNAVIDALKWLARQQADDGSWHYSLPAGPSLPDASRIEATAWVLTAMVADCHTPTRPGPFRAPMKQCVAFLLAQQRASPHENDFSGKDNAMVAHALSTRAIAEVYPLDDQASLREPVRRAAELIIATQDSKIGGWLTTTGKPAGLAATYRQLAALLAAGSALKDPKCHEAARRASKFLNTLQPRDVAPLGSARPDKQYIDEAMDLICQMSITGKRNDPALQPRIHAILERGPARNDAVYNYYATQAVFDWDGDGSWSAWDKWVQTLRQELTSTQITKGDEAGSWPPGTGSELADDRLYRTVLNCLTLQVYTRHMQRYFHFR
jgi:hypothetical protein